MARLRSLAPAGIPQLGPLVGARAESGGETRAARAAGAMEGGVRCAQGGRGDELSCILTRCSWARPLLTAVMHVQLGTPCPTNRTISDREQATK
jgi:hypothetical protein